MSHWLNTMKISDEFNMSDSGKHIEAVKSLIAKFKLLNYKNEFDKETYDDTCKQLDEYLEQEDWEEEEDALDGALRIVYDFGDMRSLTTPIGKRAYIPTKLLFVTPPIWNVATQKWEDML